MTSTSPDWTFDGTWPHAPNWFSTPAGQLHYIDEGPRAGRPVVLVHGNPTWGYLFRHFVTALTAAGYRVIVPDLLGFGRSDKPEASELYSIEAHALRLAALLDSLDLDDATLVPHDWGGPIAMYWAAKNPARVHSLAILNSFAHRPRGPVPMAPPLRLFRVRGIGELLVKVLHLIVRVFLFKAGVVKRARMTAAVRAAYVAPHPRGSDRTAILAFARQFPQGPDGAVSELLETIHAGLPALAARPALIVWADKDVVFGDSALARWREDFPAAEVLHVPDAGHFLQEDAHEIVAPAIVEFLVRHEARAVTSRAQGDLAPSR
jgi:pimeloyl-ACP methyl ester carboxylesterase